MRLHRRPSPRSTENVNVLNRRVKPCVEFSSQCLPPRSNNPSAGGERTPFIRQVRRNSQISPTHPQRRQSVITSRPAQATKPQIRCAASSPAQSPPTASRIGDHERPSSPSPVTTSWPPASPPSPPAAPHPRLAQHIKGRPFPDPSHDAGAAAEATARPARLPRSRGPGNAPLAADIRQLPHHSISLTARVAGPSSPNRGHPDPPLSQAEWLAA